MEIKKDDNFIEFIVENDQEKEFVLGYLNYGLELIEAQAKLKEAPEPLKKDFKEAIEDISKALKTEELKIKKDNLVLLAESIKTFLRVAGKDENLKVKKFRDTIISFSDGILKINKSIDDWSSIELKSDFIL